MSAYQYNFVGLKVGSIFWDQDDVAGSGVGVPNDVGDVTSQLREGQRIHFVAKSPLKFFFWSFLVILFLMKSVACHFEQILSRAQFHISLNDPTCSAETKLNLALRWPRPLNLN